MNLSSLADVADFAAKADFFTWQALLAGACLALLALWLKPSAVRTFGRGDFPFLCAVLVVPYVLFAGLVRLDLLGLLAMSALLIAAGFLERRLSRRRAPAADLPVERTPAVSVWSRRSRRIAIAALAGVTLFNIVDDRLWIHYDYFSQSISAIDLGMNGQSPSAWMKTFDPSRWFVVSQGIMPVLDAFEVFLNGTVTATLSQLLLLLLMIMLIRAAPPRPEHYIVLAAVLAMHLIDYNRSPRPHIFVGVLGALFLLRLSAHARWSELSVYLVLLILAKRDGLLLAALLASAYVMRYVNTRFGWKAVAGVGVVLIAAGALLLNSWVAIWQRTPLDAFIFAITRAGYWELIQKPEVAQSLVAGLVVIAAMAANRVPAPVVLVPVIFTGYVLLSAITVHGMENYNFGTILRKLFFMQTPVLLCGLLIARRRALVPAVREAGGSATA